MKNRTLIFRILLITNATLLSQGVEAQTFLDLLKRSTSTPDRNSSENIVALSQDGLKMTFFDGIRASGPLSLYAEKDWKPSNDIYFFPHDIKIEQRDSKYNYWRIPPGGKSSMSSSSYSAKGNPPYFIHNKNGSFTYNSWDGKSRDNNGKNYGNWITSGFKYYALAWIIPENIEVIGYKSNADGRGRWQFKAPVLSFMATNINNFTYSITYRVNKSEILEAKTLP